MIHSLPVLSLMLIAFVPSLLSIAEGKLLHAPFHRHKLGLAGRDQSLTIESGNDLVPTTSHPCTSNFVNGTGFASSNSRWTLLCDVDFYAQDISPFLLTASFEQCLTACEENNKIPGEPHCAAFVFAPSRLHDSDDCYLKSGSENAVDPATTHLIGAVLMTTSSTSSHTATSSSSPSTATSVSPLPGTETSSKMSQSDATTASPAPESSDSGKVGIVIPTVTKSTYIGSSVDEVASEYVSHAPARPQQMAGDLLQAGVNVDLITTYPIAPDTGTWTDADSSDYKLAKMTVTPRLARDGGRGGNINGTNVFIFCDTSTYGKDRDSVLGYLNGFVSSSVAVDTTMNALTGHALNLTNSLGQWQDDVGRMRGWVPMTTGEEAFNTAISGQGYRYAVWPNSSPILLNSTHAIMYAPLVYLQVDMQDQSSPSYTSLGNTLLLISIDPTYGPHADRLQNQFFKEDEVNWGSLGGIRAWDSHGPDSDGGQVYVFGQHPKGIMVGKVDADHFDDRSHYSYWDGKSWTSEMPPSNSTEDALFINQPVMNMDLIFSPAHRTFIMVYLTPQADNTFYYRYLGPKDQATPSFTPPYEAGGDSKYVENILTQKWSDQQVLFTVPAPERGYAYAGGIHAGYFGDDDLTGGGGKILCTWTEHTKVDPQKPDSGYAHKSQVIEFAI